MTTFAFRAMPDWPYPPTPAHQRRGPHTFPSAWSRTTSLLHRELRLLKGGGAVIGAGFRERDLRLDGLPRSDARAPSHPGVEISFNAFALPGNPRLVYATDVCARWEHNVHSIALGLQALRAVDRYGITRRAEQYAGWRELTTGADDQPSITRGRRLIREAGSSRAAKRATHPDAGGDRLDFESVLMAERAISEVGA